MKYRVLQFRKAWNNAVKKEHRIMCSQSELHSLLQVIHFTTARRYVEVESYVSKNGTTQVIAF